MYCICIIYLFLYNIYYILYIFILSYWSGAHFSSTLNWQTLIWCTLNLIYLAQLDSIRVSEQWMHGHESFMSN